MRQDPDVLVIGAGVAGLCCAYYLRRAGIGVTVVERGPVGGPQSCSVGNTGFIGTHRVTGPVLDLKRRSLALLRELCASGPLAPTFTDAGMVLAFRTAEGFAEARRDPALRVLEPDELTGFGLDVHGALYNEDAAHLHAEEFVTRFARMLQGMGVEIHAGTEATGFEVGDGTVGGGRTVKRVTTTRGDFQPCEVVIAAGVWSARCARMLAVGLELQPVKGYSVTVKLPPDAPRRPVLLSEGLLLGKGLLLSEGPLLSGGPIAVAPLGDRLRFAGVAELAGFDTTISGRQVDAILRTVRSYLPRLEHTETVQMWSGLRPSTPDGLPYLGRAQAYRNLYLATGYGHVGMGLAPAAGELVARTITGEPPDIDPIPLRVNRFSSG